jgi:YesN/AraC family two-component response regulator
MTTILIIDDEKPTLQMLTLLLEASGYTVLTAENEQQGLSVFREERPEIVLTDIKMPGKDGLDVLRQIKSISPDTEVFVITGHGDRDLKERAMTLNASAFFNKPLDTDALDEALQAAKARLADKTP